MALIVNLNMFFKMFYLVCVPRYKLSNRVVSHGGMENGGFVSVFLSTYLGYFLLGLDINSQGKKGTG